MAGQLKLGLVQRGLLLISVPLVFQLLLVAGLYRLNESAELAAAKAKAAGVSVEKIQELIEETLVMAKAIDGKALSKPDFNVMEYRQRMNSIEQKADLLLREETIKGQQREALEELVRNMKTLKRRLNQLLRVYLTNPDQLKEVSRNLRDDMRDYYENVGMNAMLRILNQNRAIMDSAPKLQEETRIKTKLILISLVLLNVSFTFILALAFTRNIARRVMKLAHDSEQIAQGRELSPALAGNDEIADVDRAFHDLSDRLAVAERARQSLLSMFTHDLRTPLSNILLIVENLATGSYGAIQPEGETKLAVAQKSGDRMLKMITELLELDKLRSGQIILRKVDLSVRDLLLEATEMVAPQAAHSKVEVALGEVSSALEINADYDRSIQILLNLLTNAIKFSPAGSVIILRATRVESNVKIFVIDRGSGVSPSKSAEIFDAYKQSTAEDALRGYGLGLAICKSLVNLQGGEIGVEPTENGGSTFYFTLPRASD